MGSVWLSSLALVTWLGQRLKYCSILFCHTEMNQTFSNVTFSAGIVAHKADFLVMQHEFLATVCVASVAKMMQTAPLLSIKKGYLSVLFLNSTMLTVPLPSSSAMKNHRKYNTIFNFHLPQVGRSFMTKFLSAGF